MMIKFNLHGVGFFMLLSVIIPVYNTPSLYIKECLNSIKILDDLCRYEVIIINDGSTNPDTLTLLQKYQKDKHLNHFTYISQVNSGLSKARNLGIEIAKGEFILPLDSDDKISSDIVHFIEYIKKHPELEILFGDYQTFGDEDRYYATKDSFSLTELILFQNQLSACAFFRRNIWLKLGGYDESYQTFEDYEFWCRCAINNIKFKHLPYCIFFYRKIYNGQSLLQKSLPIHQEYQDRISFQYTNNVVNLSDLYQLMNQKLINQVKLKKKKALAILLCAYFPRMFEYLCNINVFKFKDNFIER